VAACGRRWGKTQGGALIATDTALRGGVVWWIGPTYRTAQFGWDALRHLAWQLPGIGVRDSERKIIYPGGGIAEVRSGDDPDNLRGAGLDLAVLDEAAFMKPDVWAEAIRPALSDRRGRALFLSTPNGRNWFWSLWMYGQDAGYPDWQSWRFPTASNPFIRADEIEAARELLPDRLFKQEYLADFLEDTGAVFRFVEDCATATPPASPVEGHAYIMGCDWGRENDFTALAVLDMDTRHMVALDRFRDIGWSLQRGRLTALAAIWQPEAIWAEANSIGGPNIEALQNEGLPVIPFTTTAQSKGPLIESLALAFERGEISILNDPVLIGELQAYTMERLPSGRFAYSAPSGMHDDTVIALALAWHGASHSGLGFSFV
jgi:phage terminase large subunit-like protein